MSFPTMVFDRTELSEDELAAVVLVLLRTEPAGEPPGGDRSANIRSHRIFRDPRGWR